MEALLCTRDNKRGNYAVSLLGEPASMLEKDVSVRKGHEAERIHATISINDHKGSNSARFELLGDATIIQAKVKFNMSKGVIQYLIPSVQN